MSRMQTISNKDYAIDGHGADAISYSLFLIATDILANYEGAAR